MVFSTWKFSEDQRETVHITVSPRAYPLFLSLPFLASKRGMIHLNRLLCVLYF